MNSKPYFDAVAQEWEEMRKGFFSERVREKAFAVANPESGCLAADIGAGSGFMTEGLLQRGLRVIAVDQSLNMLAALRNRLNAPKGLAYRISRAERLLIMDETIDYVFANMLLHHAEDPKKAIGEMARILKRGGKLVITDLDEHDFEFLRREHHDRWLGFKREEVMRWFTDAGLDDVRTDCVGQDCCADSSDGADSARISIFVAYGTKV